jgi:hypothetical protein
VQSPLFELAYIAEEAFGFPKDAKPDDPRWSVSDGYWIKIAGLSLGENTHTNFYTAVGSYSSYPNSYRI